MPRFSGTLVEDQSEVGAAPVGVRPRFSGTLVTDEPDAPNDAHLSTLSPGGRAAVEQARSAADGGSFIDNTVRALGRGVVGVGSYLDELDAATNATLAPLVDPMLPDSYQKLPGATWGDRYDQALDIQRGKDKKFDEEHPYVSTGAQVAGGIASGVGAIRAAPVVGNAVLGNAGTSLGARIAASTAAGVGTGAVQGFGAGEGGASERGWEALKGAGVGAGVGAAGVPIGAAVGKGLNTFADVIASRGVPVGRGAQNVLRDTLANEGLTLEDANRLAQQYGPSAMLADATEGLRYRTEQLAQADTPARSGVVNTLRDRSAAAGGRITGAYDEALGARPNLKTELDRMSGEQKTRADALYGQARRENAPVDVSPVLSAIDDQLLTPAERIAGKADLPDDAVDAQLRWVRAHLSNGDVQRTGIDKLDKLERRIRARARVEFKTGHSDTGSALANVGRILRDQMKSSSTVYKQARETFADDASVQEAFETGQNLFAKKTHPDFLAAEIDDMSEAERQALRLGARSAVDEAMGSVRNGSVKGRQLLDSDWNERKILQVLGEDDGRRLINSLQGESEMAATANQVLGGPATARRLDNPFRSEASALPRAPQSLAHGAFTLVQKGVDAAKAAGQDRIARELGLVLTATGPERDQRAMQIMEALTKRGSASADDQKRKAVANALLKGGALAYGQTVLP